MNLKTLIAVTSIAASGTQIVTIIKNKKKIKEREAQVRERNSRIYRQVLDDMSRTRAVVDRVLDGEYDNDFGRAIRDIRSEQAFGRIVTRYDD